MILIIFAVLILVLAVCAYHSDSDLLPLSVFFIIVCVGFILWFSLLRAAWYKDYEILKISDLRFSNMTASIKEMKKTYYSPPKGLQFNMDMVNKDLTLKINERIQALTSKINIYNNRIQKWNVSYRYKFWTGCPLKLKENEFKLIKLSDYLK